MSIIVRPLLRALARATPLRAVAVALLLAACVATPPQRPTFKVRLDRSAPVWIQDVRISTNDTGSAIRGYFYQNWDPGSNVRFPGHIDLEIIDRDGNSSTWRVRAPTISRQLRYIRHGMFETKIPSCAAEGSEIVVHYSLHEDDHPAIALCDA